MKSRLAILATAITAASLAASAHADFVDGNLALLRVNAIGTGPNASLASSLSLLLYSPTGSLLQTLNLPSTGADAVTLEATSGSHDGHLNLTTNGQYLLFAGYRANAGAADPTTATSADVNRVIVRVDSNLNVDSSTALTDAYSQTHITAVASVDGNSFWTAGDSSWDGTGADLGNTHYTTTGGLRYVSALGASTTTNLSQTQAIGGSPQVDSYRSLRIQSDLESGAAVNRLYLSASAPDSFVNRGAFTTHITMPTAGSQTIEPIITGTENTGDDPTEKNVPKSDVVFLDLNPAIDGFDTAYSTGGKADYEKWGKIGSTWSLLSNFTLPNKLEINALDFTASGNAVTLYATTDGGVYRLIDTAGYNQPLSSAFDATPFIASDANTQFRGIAVFGGAAAVPVPEPASIALFAAGTMLLAMRRRKPVH